MSSPRLYSVPAALPATLPAGPGLPAPGPGLLAAGRAPPPGPGLLATGRDPAPGPALGASLRVVVSCREELRVRTVVSSCCRSITARASEVLRSLE